MSCRYALSITAAGLLAACGGSQQIGQTASPQQQGDATSTLFARRRAVARCVAAASALP